MRKVYVIFLILVELAYASASLSDYVRDAEHISDEEYEQLPTIHHIDEYNECVANPANHFCKLTIKLSSKSNDSKRWKAIEKTTNSHKYFAYNELLHAICIRNISSAAVADLRTAAEKYVMDELKLHGDLSVNITSIDCNHNDQDILKVRNIDIFFLLAVVGYVVVTVAVTLRDESQLGPVTRPFSVKLNWAKFKKMYEDVDSNSQLKSIQGLRFYTMVFIILCHTYLSCHAGFVKNTKYIEDFADNGVRYGLLILFVFLVQSFFLISGLLLAWNSFKLFQRQPALSSMKFFWVSAINRYLRLLPPVMVEIGLMSTVWLYFFFTGPVKSLYADREFMSCQKRWWSSLTFISNHYSSNESCFMIGWYLAADFQLYLFSLIVLIVLRKYPNHLKSILGGIITTAIIAHGLIVYWNNCDVIYRLFPKNLSIEAFSTLEQSILYSSTYANLATYMLGLGFGVALYKFAAKPFLTPNKHYWTLWALFLVLPPFVLFLASFTYNSVMSAVMGPLVKPLFALGLGVGVFGMSQGLIGGRIRGFFEWKPAVFLGNITYSTYVVHYPLVFSRAIVIHQPADNSHTILVTAFIHDLLLSFGCGFLMYLMVEMPFLQLQSMFVPKLGRSATKAEKNIKTS